MPADHQPNSDPYAYEDGDILRNKFGIRDQERLTAVENELSAERISEGIPDGNFDLEHLQAIHKHLFQDVYEWAGEIRTVELHKGESQFMPARLIETGMHDVHQRLKNLGFLQNVSPEEFVNQAGVIVGDINHLHPFREGNDRTQLQYLQKLGDQAGFDVAIERLHADDWIKASIDAHNAEYRPMQDCILGITSEHERFLERSKSHDRDRSN